MYAEKTISEFIKSLNADQRESLIDQLDELVHDAKASEAAAVNIGGIESQVEYLGLDVVRLAELIAQSTDHGLLIYWLRIGDMDENRSGTELKYIAQSLAEHGITTDDLHWFTNGFEWGPYVNHNFVSCYVGDIDANHVRGLTKAERDDLETMIRTLSC